MSGGVSLLAVVGLTIRSGDDNMERKAEARHLCVDGLRLIYTRCVRLHAKLGDAMRISAWVSVEVLGCA